MSGAFTVFPWCQGIDPADMVPGTPATLWRHPEESAKSLAGSHTFVCVANAFFAVECREAVVVDVDVRRFVVRDEVTGHLYTFASFEPVSHHLKDCLAPAARTPRPYPSPFISGPHLDRTFVVVGRRYHKPLTCFCCSNREEDFPMHALDDERRPDWEPGDYEAVYCTLCFEDLRRVPVGEARRLLINELSLRFGRTKLIGGITNVGCVGTGRAA